MNDTKVQRYTPEVVRKQVATGASYGLAEMVVREHGAYILHTDHTRIVAEKDAELEKLKHVLAEVVASEAELSITCSQQATLLAKYQRLHAADVALDAAMFDTLETWEPAAEEHRLAMESLA